ncbi:MAG: hypothetical protein PHS02_01690 [Candidatus ainarchaeum sp.]|nr:hypothetical protein [Candidatus ainarchaeum sp.]
MDPQKQVNQKQVDITPIAEDSLKDALKAQKPQRSLPDLSKFMPVKKNYDEGLKNAVVAINQGINNLNNKGILGDDSVLRYVQLHMNVMA